MLNETILINRTNRKAAGAWESSAGVDLYGCDPGMIRSREFIERFTRELCELREVTRFGKPRVVHFGRGTQGSGGTLVLLFETLLVSAHFAEEKKTVCLDIFGCQSNNAERAAEVTAEFARKFFRAGLILIRT